MLFARLSVLLPKDHSWIVAMSQADIENRSATLQDCAQPTRAAFDALPLRRNRDLLRAVLIEGAEARIAQVAEEKDRGRKHPQSLIEGTKRKRSCCDCSP